MFVLQWVHQLPCEAGSLPRGGEKPLETPSASFKRWPFQMCGLPLVPTGTPWGIHKTLVVKLQE